MRQANAETSIVFVHGILSDGAAAWGSDKVTWPALLRDDARFGAPSIFVAQYATKLSSGSQWRIHDAAEQLFDRLRVRDEQGRRILDAKNIVFVAHSMGGIVVRDILVSKKSAFRDKAVGVFLVSSPAKGSAIADVYTQLFGKSLPHAQLLDLQRASSPYLQKLHADFVALIASKEIPDLIGKELVETQPMSPLAAGLFRELLTPVTPSDVGNYFGEPKRIHANHSEIAKPQTPDADQHTTLLNFWEEFINASSRAKARALASECRKGKLAWQGGNYEGEICSGLPSGSGRWERQLPKGGRLEYTGGFQRGNAHGQGSLNFSRGQHIEWVKGEFWEGRFVKGSGDIRYMIHGEDCDPKRPAQAKLDDMKMQRVLDRNMFKRSGRYVGEVIGRAFDMSELGDTTRSLGVPHGRGKFDEDPIKAPNPNTSPLDRGLVDASPELYEPCRLTTWWRNGHKAGASPEIPREDLMRWVRDDWDRFGFIKENAKLDPFCNILPPFWPEEFCWPRGDIYDEYRKAMEKHGK